MDKEKAKILMLVEGEKTDVRLMEHLLQVYGINQKHQIVSYNTDIYSLYDKMFKSNEPEIMDITQVLKEHEKDIEKKKIFDERYSDIILIFDLDPHSNNFYEEKIFKMQEHFKESSDMGKLYINYPMVEAFYHMKSIPDNDYFQYYVTIDELNNKEYKTRVNKETRNGNYTKFAVNREECSIVIRQNIEKAQKIVCNQNNSEIPSLEDVLKRQLHHYRYLFVLCTCVFYIADYNPNLIL